MDGQNHEDPKPQPEAQRKAQPKAHPELAQNDAPKKEEGKQKEEEQEEKHNNSPPQRMDIAIMALITSQNETLKLLRESIESGKAKDAIILNLSTLALSFAQKHSFNQRDNCGHYQPLGHHQPADLRSMCARPSWNCRWNCPQSQANWQLAPQFNQMPLCAPPAPFNSSQVYRSYFPAPPQAIPTGNGEHHQFDQAISQNCNDQDQPQIMPQENQHQDIPRGFPSTLNISQHNGANLGAPFAEKDQDEQSNEQDQAKEVAQDKTENDTSNNTDEMVDSVSPLTRNDISSDYENVNVPRIGQSENQHAAQNISSNESPSQCPFNEAKNAISVDQSGRDVFHQEYSHGRLSQEETSNPWTQNPMNLDLSQLINEDTPTNSIVSYNSTPTNLAALTQLTTENGDVSPNLSNNKATGQSRKRKVDEMDNFWHDEMLGFNQEEPEELEAPLSYKNIVAEMYGRDLSRLLHDLTGLTSRQEPSPDFDH